MKIEIVLLLVAAVLNSLDATDANSKHSACKLVSCMGISGMNKLAIWRIFFIVNTDRGGPVDHYTE